MNYKRHYDLLIERARTRTLDGYKEMHHIVPKCMGGTDDKSNLVALTAEEHFLAHQLLAKEYRTKELCFAVICMSLMKNEYTAAGRSKNKTYGWLKRMRSELVNMKGENNPFYGKKHTPETIAILSEKAKARDPATRKHSDETKKKMSKSGIGKHTKHNGENHYNFGKTASEATKQKMRDSHAKRREICPFCGKVCSQNRTKAKHFDNCKHKESK